MRQIQIGAHGMLNPSADTPCGPIDAKATLPEPVHIGGCKGCRDAIHQLLKARHDSRPKAERIAGKQDRFNWWPAE